MNPYITPLLALLARLQVAIMANEVDLPASWNIAIGIDAYLDSLTLDVANELALDIYNEWVDEKAHTAPVIAALDDAHRAMCAYRNALREALEADVGYVAVARVGVDAVLIVEAIGEAELDINAGARGVVAQVERGWIVFAKMQELVIDVHLDVEGILQVALGVELAFGIEDDLRVVEAADVVCRVAEGGDVSTGFG